MSGYLAKHLLGRLGARRVDRRSGHAGHHHDIALAVELLDQPLGGDATRLLLVDRHVVGAGLRNLAVVSDDHHALVARVLDRAVERRRRDRIDDDRLRALLHHGVDLLDLALRVGAGDLHLQIDLVGEILVRRHRLDHVGGFRLPVVADVAHRQKYLEFLVGSLGARSQPDARGQSGGSDSSGPFLPLAFHRISSLVARRLQASSCQLVGAKGPRPLSL